ncbi:MAG: methyl-accepting chemotaxis protein [Gloeomargaritaceae cyanobacterium C42_A2020_066]|nr:methyl-accepting chemotaxis protein [Gloeomargaritaceae cyanobacterium C42_A2020_066]
MAPKTNYLQEYQRALSAYMNGDYPEAASITDELLQEHGDEPNLQLLRGHIHRCLLEFEAAKGCYHTVLNLTSDQELLGYAREGIVAAEEALAEDQTHAQLEGGQAFFSSLDQAVTEAGGGLGAERPDIDPYGEPTFGEINPFALGLQAAGSNPFLGGEEGPPLEPVLAESNPFGGVELGAEEDLAETRIFRSPEAASAISASPETWGSAEDLESEPMTGDRTLIMNMSGTSAIDGEAVVPLPVGDDAPPMQNLFNFEAQVDEPAMETTFVEEESAPLVAQSTSDRLTSPRTSGRLTPATPATPVASGRPAGSTTSPTAVRSQGAPMRWLVAGGVGAAAALVGFAIRQPVVAPIVSAGAAGTAAAYFASRGRGSSGGGGSMNRQALGDLISGCEALGQGNYTSARLSLDSTEMGDLVLAFNSMVDKVSERTSELQTKAEEVEQAREDLQRQVIRLLDDVEGAARGDLTVQAEVTADILGAVADSFNLTIQNIRQIVQQVKMAAVQVNRSAAESEIFARELSANALRQAQDLAVTLNSVQLMMDSIQRVADSVREAEEVGRRAEETAFKGGEAVDETVVGIQTIRESVAETTRKVKRLAESTQEISKIVNLISQVASKMNLLALNASIEAARAGESGRGFAIVADEVRQLSDRVGKSSKEIEQIVLQIQSETGTVMTAMEEGTQQVIRGTRLAEQAKRSLEEIIQVSQRIAGLVQSITADTIKQTEVSRSVTQVMQSVELTAQETSQEAQKVSVSLQTLVEVSRMLQSSVERFRLGSTEPL